MFLAVAGLATFGASCSKSDDNGGGGTTQLVVSADKSSVEEGTSVTFTAKADGKTESGADFYVEGTKVANPYKFETPGSYKVVAKKANFKDSNAITITVTKKGEEPQPEKKTLVLTASATTAEVGQPVTFSVKDNENAAVAGATITLNGATVANPWTATEAGTYKFKASKADYNDSAEVTVIVTAPTTVGENQIMIAGNIYDLDYSRMLIDAYNTGTAQAPNFVLRKYDLNGGGYAYMYTFFAVNSDAEGAATAEVYTHLNFFIPQVEGQATKTPFNTPPAEWGFYNYFTYVGDDLYSEADESLELAWGARVEGEEGYFALEASGQFTVAPSAFQVKYNKEVDALYYRSVAAPTAATRSIKNVNMNKVKNNTSGLVRAKF